MKALQDSGSLSAYALTPHQGLLAWNDDAILRLILQSNRQREDSTPCEVLHDG